MKKKHKDQPHRSVKFFLVGYTICSMMQVDIRKNIQDVVLFVLTKKSMAVFI